LFNHSRDGKISDIVGCQKRSNGAEWTVKRAEKCAQLALSFIVTVVVKLIFAGL
jgi:hypothetical protein